MTHLPLEQFKHAWIFRHQSMPLSAEQLAQIKPMSEERSATLWDTFISKNAVHPELFTKHDWPTQEKHLTQHIPWESRWESDNPSLPDELLLHINWEENTTVYYCLHRQCILETTWGLFKQCWKNFLFLDDGSLLIGKKRQQAVQFNSNGTCRYGDKPKN
ncbi:DUF2947 domain-containing protein [Thalassotalea hakodatensis]|uniref:DUF2947 domain-containing protein n=1 Tax=Thalassotalea hakodatensis TaxID=3030492 RepID=UPI002572806D|nr:DUF2947 domain-containing protein [Thalassotalea hakodatensis]